MGFFDRLGHGFMVALHSLAFGFHHFSVFWYMLFYGIALIPVYVLGLHTLLGEMFNFGSKLGMAFFSFAFQLVSYIFIVAIVRRVVFSFKKKKLGFWDAMAMDIKLWVAIGIYAFVYMVFDMAIYAASERGIENIDGLLVLARLAWQICTLFFVSVVTIEECGFLDGVGRSTRYFGRVFLEVICAVLMFFVLFVGVAAVLDMLFNLEFRYVIFQSLSDFASVVTHPEDLGLLTPSLTLAAVTGWFFFTGVAVSLPAMYYMARHNKKSPF